MQEGYKGAEKRKHERKNFQEDQRPLLKIGIQEFEVIDISREGIRFVNDKAMHYKGWVNGEVVFPNLKSVEIDGIVVRQQDGDFGLHLVNAIELE